MPTTTFYNRILAPQAYPIFSYDTTSYDHIQQAWMELEMANYKFGNSMSFITSAKWAKYYEQEHILPIAAINCGLHSFDTNAVANGNIIIVGEQYSDGTNVANAYLKHNSVLAALYADNIYQNMTYDLLYSNLLLQNNNDYAITHIELKVGKQATVYSLKQDTRLPYTFTEAGPLNMQFTIYLSNGTSKVINQTINVIAVKKSRAALDPNLCQPIRTVITGRAFMQPDTISNNFGASVEVGFYRHFSGIGNCDTMLSNPIIFVDGYDDSSKRGFADIYGVNMSYLNPLNSADSLRVGDSLRHQGHDIFIFNPRWYINPAGRQIDGGTDYIERNAYALEALIQQINQRLAWQGSTDSLTIVGPSMGGQISRYALADMERAGTPHRC
jgi:hypothetical protein